MKKLFTRILGLAGVLALIGAGAAYLGWRWLEAQGDLSAQVDPAARGDGSEPIEFTVPKGTSPRTIAAELKRVGLIDDDRRFFYYLRHVAKRADRLQAGEYLLHAGMTADEIITALQSGRQKELRFTIPEGARKEDIARLVAASGITDEREMLRAINAPSRMREFGLPAKGAGGQPEIPGGIEGYLFPDTYQFPKGTSADEIVRRMQGRLRDVVDEKMQARMKELGWNLHQVLTLAAIVEKETGQPHERPHISSVFHNRLRKGMKLQTDPTVIYGIQNYDGNIRKKDLLTPHPYNTYTMVGLPPGPIASPGRAAIEAALWPDDTDDLFFVSRNDGTHIFCPTLACHNAAVQKWQVEYFRKKRRANGG